MDAKVLLEWLQDLCFDTRGMPYTTDVFQYDWPIRRDHYSVQSSPWGWGRVKTRTWEKGRDREGVGGGPRVRPAGSSSPCLLQGKGDCPLVQWLPRGRLAGGTGASWRGSGCRAVASTDSSPEAAGQRRTGNQLPQTKVPLIYFVGPPALVAPVPLWLLKGWHSWPEPRC